MKCAEKVSFDFWLCSPGFCKGIGLFGEGFLEVLLRIQPEVHVSVLFAVKGRVASGLRGLEERKFGGAGVTVVLERLGVCHIVSD